MESERSQILASKMTETVERLARGDSIETIVDGVEDFIGDFHSDFAKLAARQKMKQTKSRRRQRKKSQMDMFKPKPRS